MAAEEERRALERVVIKGRVRVRPAGSSGMGRLCRVRDAHSDGVRLVVDDDQGIDSDWHVLEVLTASGRQQRAEVDLAVIWAEHGDDGHQHVGCSFVH